MLPYTFLGRVVGIYTTPPIRINCAGRRRKYAAKDIEARYYDANERPERPDGARASGDRAVALGSSGC